MATEITCIVPHPSDPYLRIDRVGGTWGTKSEAEVIAEIEAGAEYVVDVDAAHVDLIIGRRGAQKYLRTDPNQTDANNLLCLRACP